MRLGQAGSGLVRRDCRASYRQRNLFLRFKLGGVNRLGIEVKGRARLRVAQKLLNRLYVLTPANQEGRKAVTEIVAGGAASETVLNFRVAALRVGFRRGGGLSFFLV
jgi:hypothetical protein